LIVVVLLVKMGDRNKVVVLEKAILVTLKCLESFIVRERDLSSESSNSTKRLQRTHTQQQNS